MLHGSQVAVCLRAHVRLAVQTDSLRLLKAVSSGVVYYDTGLKRERASTRELKNAVRVMNRVQRAIIGATQKPGRS